MESSEGVSEKSSAEDQRVDENEGAEVEEPKLSKKQQKKMQRRENFLEYRKEKRKIEKEKRKLKRQAMAEAGIEVPRRKPRYLMSQSKCRQAVAIDMAFSEYMNQKEINATIAQLAFSYSANRHAENPMQFSIVNLTGACREAFDNSETTKNWDVNITSEDFATALPDKKVVYLTADSDNVLADLDESCVYVIGGIVDHNRHKGLTHRLAEEKGYSHARLPISEYVKLSTRKVLTINHVYEILLNYTILKDWKESFLTVIPQRKGIASNSDGEDEANGEEAEPNSTEEKEEAKGEDKAEPNSTEEVEAKGKDKAEAKGEEAEANGEDEK